MQPRSNIDAQLADENLQANDVQQQSPDQGVSFTEVHAQLAPVGGSEEEEGPVVKVEVGRELKEEVDEKEVEEEEAEEAPAVEQNLSLCSEGVSNEYALSSTVLHEDLKVAGEEKVKEMEMEAAEDL